MSRKLFVALENEVITELVSEEQQRIQELEEQVSDHEVTEAFNEVQADKDVSDNAEADIETLTKVNDILTEATESNKALTKDVLQMSKIVTESICNRLGYKVTNSLFIATESIGSNTKYQEAISLENFSAFIKRTWEAIIKFFKRIVEGIKTLWNKLFSRTKMTKIKNEQNKNTIEKLKLELVEKSTETKKDDQKETGSLETKTIKNIIVNRNESKVDLGFIMDFMRLTDDGGFSYSNNTDNNRKHIYNAISSAVSEAEYIISNLNKDVIDLFRLVDKINSLDDAEAMNAILEKAKKQYILSKKDSFRKICIKAEDTTEGSGSSNTSWVIITPYDLSKDIINRHRFADVEDIKATDNILWKNRDLLKQLEKTLNDVEKMKHRLTELSNEYEKEFNKELKIGDYDKATRDRLPIISGFLKIINVYLLTIPRICGDISNITEDYIGKNLQVNIDDTEKYNLSLQE